jgi:hypothetical protein
MAQHPPDYWKTHTATTPEEANEKMAAYWAASNNGVKGQPYPNSKELALISQSSSGQDASSALTGAAAGAGIGGSIGGPVGGAIGGALGLAGGGLVSAFSQPSATKAGSQAALNSAASAGYTAADFGGGTGAGSSGRGSLSIPTMPAGPVAQPAVAKGDPSNGPWDAFVPTGGIPATGGSMATPNYAPQTGTTGNPYLDAILAQTTGPGGVVPANTSIIQNQVAPAVAQQKDTTYQTNAGIQATLAPENQLIGGYAAFNGGLAAQGQQAASGANAANLGYLKSYQDTLGGMSQLTPTPYQGDYNSNPADVARQQQSYNTLNGIGGGSLNYTAAQAQLYQAQYQTAELAQMQAYEADLKLAESNGQDVSAERDALAQLKANAGGALDVVNGANAPEAYNAQLQALSKMQGLTDPQRTAQEEFLYEQQRQREVQDQSTSRAAVMQNLRARGMSGSGMELTDQAIEDQITSQNRLLGDLGTQATAVARAQANLNSVGSLSSTMVGQGNQVAQGNQQVRAGSAQTQGALASDIRAQGDAMSQFNANAFNQNSMFNAGQQQDASKTNAMLMESNNEFNANAYNSNQQFNANAGNQNSMFNAGQQNQASANNQQTQLSGSLGAAQQAASMRTAADAVGMANQAQQGISNRANDIFRADQQVQATNRATDVFNAGQGTTQTNLGNTNQAINASSLLGDKSFGAGMTGLNDTRNYWNTVQQTGQQNTQNALGFGALATGTNISGASAATDALSKAAGNFAAGQAQGTLGTNIYGTQGAYTPYVSPYYQPPKQPGA